MPKPYHTPKSEREAAAAPAPEVEHDPRGDELELFPEDAPEGIPAGAMPVGTFYMTYPLGRAPELYLAPFGRCGVFLNADCSGGVYLDEADRFRLLSDWRCRPCESGRGLMPYLHECPIGDAARESARTSERIAAALRRNAVLEEDEELAATARHNALFKACRQCGVPTRYRSPNTGEPVCGDCLV